MSNAIRSYLREQQARVAADIMTLQHRLDMLIDMIADLDKATAPPPKPPKPRGKVVAKTLTALDAAGDEGLTARELAAFIEIPVGTASGRLTMMKQEGMIRHDANNHKYFAIHSTREDNNLGYSP